MGRTYEALFKLGEEMRRRMKKGQIDGLEEIEEAVKQKKSMREIRTMSTFASNLFINNKLATVVEK